MKGSQATKYCLDSHTQNSKKTQQLTIRYFLQDLITNLVSVIYTPLPQKKSSPF